MGLSCPHKVWETFPLLRLAGVGHPQGRPQAVHSPAHTVGPRSPQVVQRLIHRCVCATPAASVGFHRCPPGSRRVLVVPRADHVGSTAEGGWGAVSITDDTRAVEPRAESRPVEGRSDDGGFDRSPPQDVAAEQCVLGGMLLSKDAIADVIEILKVADFYRPNPARIFDTDLDLYGRGE